MKILTNYDYHVVELNQYGVPADVHAWLEEQFGVGNGDRWFYRHSKLFFLDKQDHLMFVLRWS
jgi:hypothetical protein